MSRPTKPLSIPAILGLVLGLAAIATIVASGIGCRVGWWHFTRGLQVSEWETYGAAIALVLSGLGLIQTRPRAARRGLAVAALGLLVALLPLAMALQWEHASRTTPPINDISTDTADSPVFWDMPNPTDYPGAQTAALQRAAYPDLVPLKLGLPPEQAFAQALSVAEEKGWTHRRQRACRGPHRGDQQQPAVWLHRRGDRQGQGSGRWCTGGCAFPVAARSCRPGR